MKQQEISKKAIEKIASGETQASLQDRLDSAAIDIDLSAAPASQVSESFVEAVSPLLERSIKDLTPGEIRAITAEVKERSESLQPKKREIQENPKRIPLRPLVDANYSPALQCDL